MGHSVVALVPIDPKLVGGPVGAFAAICTRTGDDNNHPVFDLLGVPPISADVNGQQVPLAVCVRYPLAYMGTQYRPFGWCWPEEWTPPNAGLEPAKLVH